MLTVLGWYDTLKSEEENMKKIGTIILTIYLTIATLAAGIFGYLYFKQNMFLKKTDFYIGSHWDYKSHNGDSYRLFPDGSYGAK